MSEKNTDSIDWEVCPIITDCKARLLKFPFIQILFTGCENNLITHDLANLAFTSKSSSLTYGTMDQF